ncbi:MAG: MYXO-CTERM sorting domain-containing protein [Polyangiales bacterium]
MTLPTRSVFLGLLAATTVTLATVAGRADIAPPPNWKESCTEEQQKKPGEECLSCSAFYGNAQHCSKLLGSYAFQSRCKTRGASVWTELWCRTTSPSAKKVPPNVLAALGNANDDGDAGAAAPTPSTSADAAPAPTTTATAEPSTTTTATTTPTSASTAPPATKLPTEDGPRKGGCGACVVGAGSSSSLGIAAFALALVVALTRRRRP